MQNLEQIRAKHALEFWNNSKNDDRVKGEAGGDVVSGLSSLIINNGLLATIAFAKEKEGHKKFMEEIGRFLSKERMVLNGSISSLDDFIKILTRGDSNLLQQATAEALAYISYLKRFRGK